MLSSSDSLYFEAVRASLRYKCHYSVHPRYTPGSGAQVDERTAFKVAAEEKIAYEFALSGRMGEAEKERAQKLGLIGISEFLTEGRKAWTVRDLCTGESYSRPFASARKS